jgi:hypothetical protein
MAILHRAPAQLSSNLERQLSDLPKDSFGSSGACRRRLGKVRYVTYSRRRRGSALGRMLSFARKIDRQLPVFFYLSESAAMQRERMDHFSTGMQVSTDSIEKFKKIAIVT